MNILIVIDMLNGFCRKGYPLSLPQSTSKIEKYIISKIIETNQIGGRVIFVCDNHTIDDPEINNPYPQHCMHGTNQAEIIDDLQPFANNENVVVKNTLSIFYNTTLQYLLNESDSIDVEVTGVCTEICVLFAIYELRIRGYRVSVSSNGVLPLDSSKQEEYLNYFENNLGAKVCK